MSRRFGMSRRTRMNWLLDAVMALGGLLAALSGVYFLFLPSGGYQGGRNPLYGVTILFSRETWSVLHTWASVIMGAAIAIHLAIHWTWVKHMTRRTLAALRRQGPKFSRGSLINLLVNTAIALSFLICALSGLYFLFGPSGGFEGGQNAAWDPGFLFSRTTWDMIHTWSGVVLITSAAAHFAIHWRWVKNVTTRLFLSLASERKLEPANEMA